MKGTAALPHCSHLLKWGQPRDEHLGSSPTTEKGWEGPHDLQPDLLVMLVSGATFLPPLFESSLGGGQAKTKTKPFGKFCALTSSLDLSASSSSPWRGS
jgi:hypothetical protein